jgi:glycosyl transferase family 87
MISRAAATVLLLVFLLTTFRNGWKTPTTDFPNYYTAAVLVRNHVKPLHAYYDWTWFQRQMNYAGIETQLGAYPPQSPLTMLPIVPLANFPVQRAKQIWLTLNLLFLLATIWLLARIVDWPVAWIGLLAVLVYSPIGWNFYLGQYYVFLLFLLTLAVCCLERRRASTGGFLCGATFGLKVYGAPFLFYCAAKRDWRAVAGFLLAVTLALATAIALFGWTDVQYFGAHILSRALDSGTIDPYNSGNGALTTLFRHLFISDPDLNPHPLWRAPYQAFFLQALTTLCVLLVALLAFMRQPSKGVAYDFSWFTVAVLLVSTNTATYTFVLLFLPLVVWFRNASLAERILLVGAFATLNLPLPTSIFPKLWLLSTLFYVFGREYFRGLGSRQLAATVAVAGLIAGISTASHYHRYQMEPLQHYERVGVGGISIFETSPAITRDGLFYQAIGGESYVLRWVHSNSNVAENLSFPGEPFHPVAMSPDGPIYFELVANGRSTFLQFDSRTRSTSPISSSQNIRVPDSVVSPDGQWVATESSLSGLHQILLKNVATGAQRLLTPSHCDSRSPAWELDSKALIFASDCGKGIGLSVLYRAEVTANAVVE